MLIRTTQEIITAITTAIALTANYGSIMVCTTWVASEYLNYQREAGEAQSWRDLKSNVRKFPGAKCTCANVALATQYCSL